MDREFQGAMASESSQVQGKVLHFRRASVTSNVLDVYA